MTRREAIEHAAGVRLRPILMTTAAMVVGMVPLIIASGAGAQSRFAIGIVIAFGMTIGTLFTLFVTPAVYTFIARDHRATRRRQGAARAKRSPIGCGSAVSPLSPLPVAQWARRLRRFAARSAFRLARPQQVGKSGGTASLPLERPVAKPDPVAPSPHLRHHLASRRRQDHADRKAAAVRRRDPARRRGARQGRTAARPAPTGWASSASAAFPSSPR